MIAEHVIGQPGGVRGQRDNGVEPVGGQWPIQGFPGSLGRFRARLPVTGFREVARGCFGPLEQFLAEGGQHRVCVSHVELDELGEVGRVRSAQPGQVGVEVVLELVRQGRELWFGHLGRPGELDRVDQLGPRLAQQGQRLFQHGGGAGPGILDRVAPHAQARPGQRGRVEERGVVAAVRARDYTTFLDPSALAGARLGVWRDAVKDAGARTTAVLEQALALLREAGAELVDPVELPGAAEVTEPELAALTHEFKHDLNAYLAGLCGPHPADLAELIKFNMRYANVVLAPFGQELLERAEATTGDLAEPGYRAARAEASQRA